MRTISIAALLVPVLGACHLRAGAVRPAPLDTEGELLVYVVPQREPSSVMATLASASAVAADGSAVPLAVVTPALTAPGRRDQKLLARGRLPPGNYTGLEVAVARATVTTEEGSTDLLVPKEPLRIEAGFRIAERRAVVLWLEPGVTSPRAGVEFRPALSAAVPRPAPAQSIGYSAGTGSHDVSVFDKFTHEVTAVVPVGAEPAGVALDPITGRAYVALHGEDAIDVIDTVAVEFRERIRLRPGDAPSDVALIQNGRVLVSANEGSNSVSFVDLAAKIEADRVQVGISPSTLLVDRAERRAYVFNHGSSNVTILDLGTRSVAGTIGTDAEPLRGDINRAGNRLYVVHGRSTYMNVYSLPDLALVGRVFVGLGMTTVKVDPRTDLVYVAVRGDRRLLVFDPFSLLPVDEVEVAEGISYLAIDDVNNTLFCVLREHNSIAVVDLTSRRTLSSIDVGQEPYSTALAGERR